MADKKLNVLLINHSDSRGGASVVSYRLMEALNAAGVTARMLVVHKDGQSRQVERVGPCPVSKLPFLAEHAQIFMLNGFDRSTLFRISTGRFGMNVAAHPWVSEADAVVINWINQGMLSLGGIGRLARQKPVFWTMHDQWNMTGVCHYAAGCDRWRAAGCRDCPLVGRGRLAEKVFNAKKRLYGSADIHFVAVSEALASLCRQSGLMRDADITVIPNAFPVDEYAVKAVLSREEAGLPPSGRIVTVSAARLDDPVKNFPLAVEIFNEAAADNVCAVFCGDIRHPEILETLRIPYRWLGYVSEPERRQSVMAHSDAVLSTSVWETLPGTVVEGVSCGAVAVTTDNGGQSEIVADGLTGYLFKGDVATAVRSGAEALKRALEMPQTAEARLERHREMERRFSAPVIARRYIELIESKI